MKVITLSAAVVIRSPHRRGRNRRTWSRYWARRVPTHAVVWSVRVPARGRVVSQRCTEWGRGSPVQSAPQNNSAGDLYRTGQLILYTTDLKLSIGISKNFKTQSLNKMILLFLLHLVK